MNETAIAELLAAALKRAEETPRPESTYRLQFHAGFTFRDAIPILPYLSELGISHVYASPYLKARPGSTHGYDIVDHRALNPEIGSPEDHEAFVAAVRQNGLGLILDIVPNHMGIASDENRWWTDVLENGPASPFAAYFDVAWEDTARPELRHKVLLPVLGEPYGKALEAGQLRLEFDAGRFVIDSYGRKLPAAPRSYALILRHRLEELGQLLGPETPDFDEYQSILTAIAHLPDRTDTGPEKVAERSREKEVIKRRLGELTARNGTVRGFIEENVLAFNGTAGIPHSFDLLDELLSHQCYRLSFWRVALEEINYRRFFDVNELAAICVEREDVFQAVHELVFRLIGEGKADGVRVDHPDGLYDPRTYFQRLQRQYLLALMRANLEARPADEAPPAWAAIADSAAILAEGHLATANGPPRPWPLFAVAEKILGARESLPADWAVSGTVGYEFIRAVTGLFVDGSAEGEFTRLYRDLNPDYQSFNEVFYRAKRLILSASLAAELNMLAYQLDRLAQKTRLSRDFTRNGLRDAIREVIACFPVYRSYISDRGGSDRDREVVERAVRLAGVRNPLIDASVLRFVRDMILLRYPDGAAEADQAEQRRFVGRFQQLTSPVMAKGLEDTAFYQYNRLVSLNEVGGSLDWPKGGVEAFHRFCVGRQAQWPYSLSPLSTHDTKRSEDVRARINVLSEMPREWGEAVRRWFEMNAGHRREVDGQPAPDPNDEYLLYQTLIGVWPPGEEDPDSDFLDRLQGYLLKALHEAKVHSSWLNPNADYDAAVTEFARRILDALSGRQFLDDFLPFQKHVARFGAIDSLAQTTLKLTCPGAADTYQGTEIPDFSLVDPDNRRPVDYGKRKEMLNDLRKRLKTIPGLPAAAFELAAAAENGQAKLLLHWRLLHARREHPGLFTRGEYLPLEVRGEHAAHVVAFARRLEGITAIVVVARLVVKLNGHTDTLPLGSQVWGDTRIVLGDLAGGDWDDVLTSAKLMGNKEMAVGGILANFPTAVLMRGCDSEA